MTTSYLANYRTKNVVPKEDFIAYSSVVSDWDKFNGEKTDLKKDWKFCLIWVWMMFVMWETYIIQSS